LMRTAKRKRVRVSVRAVGVKGRVKKEREGVERERDSSGGNCTRWQRGERSLGAD
jgi:hypothetical protein